MKCELHTLRRDYICDRMIVTAELWLVAHILESLQCIVSDSPSQVAFFPLLFLNVYNTRKSIKTDFNTYASPEMPLDCTLTHIHINCFYGATAEPKQIRIGIGIFGRLAVGLFSIVNVSFWVTSYNLSLNQFNVRRWNQMIQWKFWCVVNCRIVGVVTKQTKNTNRTRERERNRSFGWKCDRFNRNDTVGKRYIYGSKHTN